MIKEALMDGPMIEKGSFSIVVEMRVEADNNKKNVNPNVQKDAY